MRNTVQKIEAFKVKIFLSELAERYPFADIDQLAGDLALTTLDSAHGDILGAVWEAEKEMLVFFTEDLEAARGLLEVFNKTTKTWIKVTDAMLKRERGDVPDDVDD
jgi:hypothetical protein